MDGHYLACISVTMRNRELTNIINLILYIKCPDFRHTCDGDIVTGYKMSHRQRGHSIVPSSALRATVAYDRTYKIRTCVENNVIGEYIFTSDFFKQTNLDPLPVRECVANTNIRECRASRRATVTFNIVIAKINARECRIKSRECVN